ncbi:MULTISPECIES: ABC transporter substrate-binding protein [unclassified Bradyrhizobium]|uniref:ABC transporter substrate-binding protein n=1 Tax=unclassified Bradyrhizobium TaxID=2631580 RepID=UPI001FFBD457|nr:MULTISPECIES: ABC transporter substrate-binding protein [unclassified Bradyrhizobium]MCK1294536.1 ABC transporter substrate-binding protein [Bradyrhizobium sp. 30]MCK1305319.1 ABC transporter substrate-binding protein [Bradyrhizobium sp. 45]MCK1318354.1 ABC transporter substrate-binding protein [Bradyrhizobium sp. 23]MCK1439933.1 ABC transporter substrate-binding protein [Bradyrhizobium sp. 15]MCK1508006.1 ABC transporter substrate-binding protein [Bradyrhizobium sp. 18]
MTLRFLLSAAIVALTGLPAQPALAQFKTQGVTDTEIVIGTHMDLSGPIKSWGVPASSGMKLAVEQINAAGGINGRKIKLILEDDSYDPKKAVLQTQKLIELDKAFSIVSAMGSATTLAPMPLVQGAGLTHLFPITAAEFTFKMDPAKPEDRLKFNMFSPYYDTMRLGIKYVMEKNGIKKPCIVYQDDEMGKNFTDAYSDQLKDLKVPEATRVSFKRGATDFNSQVARMKADGCDLVALGSVVRESVGIVTAAKKLGWTPLYVVSSPSYVPDLHDLGKDATEGIFGVGQTEIFYPDTATAKVKEFIEAYRKMFGIDPNLQSTSGYDGAMAFAFYAGLAGKNLTTDSLIAAMESGKVFEDIFGGAPVSFSKDNHLGVSAATIGQIKNGRWVTIAKNQSYKSEK